MSDAIVRSWKDLLRRAQRDRAWYCDEVIFGCRLLVYGLAPWQGKKCNPV